MESCKSVASPNHLSSPIRIKKTAAAKSEGEPFISKSLDSCLSNGSNLGKMHTKPIAIDHSKPKFYFDTCSPKEPSSPYSTSSIETSWFSEAIAELHLQNMSPRSDSWTDELRSRRSSMDPDLILSEEEEDTYLNLKGSENEGIELAQDLMEANAMYFLSQDTNNYEYKDIKMKGLRNKLLNVLQTEKIRQRSASQGEVLFKHSEGSTSPVKRMRSFFTRMRSHSQGDIIIPATFKSNIAMNEGKESSKSNGSSQQGSDCDEKPSSPANVSMINKFKKNIKNAPVKLFPSGSRRNSVDLLSTGKGFHSGSRRNSADVLTPGRGFPPGSRRNSTDVLSNIKSIFEEPSLDEANSVEDISSAGHSSKGTAYSQISKDADHTVNGTSAQQNIPEIFIENATCENATDEDEPSTVTFDECIDEFVVVNKGELQLLESVPDFERSSSDNNLLRPPLRRLRSKSDPSISVDESFKKNYKWEPKFLSKLKQKHKQWKKHRGSLPEELWVNQPDISSRGSSRRNSGSKVTKSKKSMLGIPIASNLLNITSSVVFHDLIHQSKSTEHLDLPEEEGINPYRGKSRSVDHTLQRPFDLDLLRKKIGERTSSEPSRDAPPSWPDNTEVNRENATPEKRGGAPRTLLSGPTITYTVQANDTLMSIAARFETTPSELTKLNRLSTRFLFPGQLLLVPDKGGAKENQGDENGSFRDCRSSPHFSDATTPLSQQSGNYNVTPNNSVDNEKSMDRECIEKFLKIQVRHITDGQGVVAGVLLVTPNAVMFDPNVSDPLVIDRGPESYGVIAPMDLVVNAALYYDIAHMKVKDTVLSRPEMPKPEIFWGPTESRSNSAEDQLDGISASNELLRASDNGLLGVMGGSEESPSKDCPYPELAPLDNDNDSSCSCGGETRETSAFPKAFEHEILTPISSDVSPTTGEPPLVSESGTLLQRVPRAPFPVTGQDDLSLIKEDASFTSKEELTTQISFSPKSSPQHPHSTSPHSFQSPSPQINHPPSSQMPHLDSPQIQIAQNQSQLCDTKAAASSFSPSSSSQDLPAQNISQKVPLHVSSSVPLTNDKKRTTSVTFSTSSESDMPPLPEDGSELPLHESRKQKVLKRISYPLSWMESFGADKDGQMMNQHQSVPASASPSGNWASPGGYPGVGVDSIEGGRPGMFSNVFSISNVSNMLTRRPSLDNFKRPTPPSSGDPLMSSLVPPNQPNELESETSNPPAQKRAQFKEGPKYGLKSMVSVDDMPDLFASFDKLIPKPASSSEESPLYLCLRMGTPISKPIPRTTPIMTYGKKTMKPEYWFSIPKTRTNELFSFFQIWANELYGELDEETIKARGFNLIDEEIEIWTGQTTSEGEDAVFGAAGELKEMTKESWEVVSMSDDLRKALYSSASLTSLDIEVFLPEVQGASEVIDDAFRKNMFKKLPARVQGYNWKQVFSTAQNGFSLKTLYRKMCYIDSPIIIFIQDTNQNKFGALVSCPLRVSDLFYGTGESFLFVCQPEFQIFPWTGENTFFVKGNNESLYIGGGDGRFGIWLDGDLYQGRTQTCKTYNNPVLSSSEDFIIKTVECWYFD